MGAQMKKQPLTERQRAVLAIAKSQIVITRAPEIEHGVYRSLVIKGMLRPVLGRYQITERGFRAAS